jgi:hypothetical protein
MSTIKSDQQDQLITELSNFLDNEGRLKQFPAKRRYKFLALQFLSTKFQSGIIYTEKEINEIIEKYHTFGDKWLLRRELINTGFLSRLKDGSQYWVSEEPPVLDQIL